MLKTRIYASVSIADLGASQDPRADNAPIINAALAKARRTDRGVYVPPGRWPYKSRIINDSALLFGENWSSVLVGSDGTDAPRTAVQLSGYLPAVRWLTLETGGAQRRGGDSGIEVMPGTTGHQIERVQIIGPAGTGIFVNGAKWGQIVGALVTSPQADGIHHTGASKHCEVNASTVIASADDYFAVVSYLGNGEPCENIRFRNIKGSGQRVGGRGLAVVGGKNIAFERFDVRDTKGFGIYVFAEVSYQTFGVSNVHFKNGTVNGTGVGAANPKLWDGMLVGEDNGQPIRNITTENVTIINAGGPVSRSFGNVSQVDLSGIKTGTVAAR